MRTVVIVRVQGLVQWQHWQSGRSGRWIAVCEPLNLVLQGESKEELYSLIPEAVDLLMRDLVRENEIDAFLRERGWSASVPAEVSPQEITFQVPWELVTRANARSAGRRAVRSLGFSFKDQTPRMKLYKQKGTNKRVEIRRNIAHDEDYLRQVLRQAGMAPDEIENLIRENRYHS